LIFYYVMYSDLAVVAVISQPVTSTSQSVNQSVSQSTSQSVNQSVRQTDRQATFTRLAFKLVSFIVG